jgi:hypothetical protein
MTTRVTVDAHAGWPVEVSRSDGSYPPRIVNPGEVQEFHVWQGSDLIIRELPSIEKTDKEAN